VLAFQKGKRAYKDIDKEMAYDDIRDKPHKSRIKAL
jgi:hypothetical protein